MVPLQEPLTQFENHQPSLPAVPSVAQVSVLTGPTYIVTSLLASFHSYGHPQGSYLFSGGHHHDCQGQGRESYEPELYYHDHHHDHCHSSLYYPQYDYYSPSEQRRPPFDHPRGRSFQDHHFNPFQRLRLMYDQRPEEPISMDAAMAFSGPSPNSCRNCHDAWSSMVASLHQYDQCIDDRHSTRHHSMDSSHVYNYLYPTNHHNVDDNNYYRRP